MVEFDCPDDDPCVGDDDGVFFVPECFGLMLGGVGGFGLTMAPPDDDDVTVGGPKLLGDILGEITAPDVAGYLGETVLGGYFGDVVGARTPVCPYPVAGFPDRVTVGGRLGDVSSDFESLGI